MELLEHELPWWWIAVVSMSFLLAVAISAFVPMAFLRSSFQKEGGQGTLWKLLFMSDKQETLDRAQEAAPKPEFGTRPEDVRQDIRQEPWVPKLEVKDWQQACQLSGCPWNFDSCESTAEVLERIWRQPLCTELQEAFGTLKRRVKHVQVAKVTLSLPPATHFAVIYTLHIGAELFGGAPLEHAVGLELGDGDHPEVASEAVGVNGLRRRRASSPSLEQQSVSEGSEIALPCLLPFYRIHDGFGIVLNSKHLPVLIGSPSDTVDGSCYYVFPVSSLEPVRRQPSYLVRFARVDRLCLACADARKGAPSVIYVEKSGQLVEDEESLISFVSDTVSSIAGQRMVPPSYLGGPATSPKPN